MNYFKKTVIFLLILCCAFSCAAVPAAATVIDSGTCGEGLNWTLSDTKLLSITGSGKMASYDNTNVAPWLINNPTSKIHIVEISSGVTSIGAYAFYNCSEIEKVYIADSVTSIEEGAFCGCKGITTVSMSDNVTSIGKYSFAGCSAMKKFELPSHLVTIGQNAFNYCTGVEKITIPVSVTSIGEDAFFWATKRIFYNGTSAQWNSISFGGDLGFDFAVVAFQNESSGGADLSVLDENNANAQGIRFTLDDASHTAMVGDGSYNSNNSNYHGCDEGRVVIPETVSKGGVSYDVTGIGECAFYQANGLREIELGSGIESIGEDAFGQCISLEKIKVSKDNANYAADPYGVLFTKDYSTLMYYPSASSLPYYSIPAATENIGNYAFYSCPNLTALMIPQTVTTIRGDAIMRTYDGETTVFYVWKGTTAAEYMLRYFSNCFWYIGDYILEGINVYALPDSLVVTEGETPDWSGLYVTQTIKTQTKQKILQLNDFDISFNNTPGVQKVTVSCGGFEKQFDLLVLAKEETSLDFGALTVPEGASCFSALYDENGRMISISSDVKSVNGRLMNVVSQEDALASDSAQLFCLDSVLFNPACESVECSNLQK